MPIGMPPKPPRHLKRKVQSHIIRRPDGGWLRVCIAVPKRGPLRVVIYARYSTDEQNPRSIDDQVAFCRHFLEQVYDGKTEITVLFDKSISGEIVSRPGIDEVFAGFRNRRWDLALTEDASRYYRHETACYELVETAVDEGIRVICINDRVDTADEEDWEDRLHEAMRHHARCNRYTSKRIKRAHEALWEMGAAVSMLRPGYRRRPTKPATKRDPAEGPFYDEIDPDWKDVIYEAFERVAKKEHLSIASGWLTSTKLPKAANAQTSDWSEKNLISLIRCKDYKGIQEHGKTFSKRKYRSGQRTQEPNDSSAIKKRKMRRLRIVPNWLWTAANAAIDERATRSDIPKGEDHPLYGIPRDSREPLSGIFCCARCRQKMYATGRNEGGYRCSQVKSGLCWNKATAVRSIAHSHLADSISSQLPVVERRLDAFLADVHELFVNDLQRQARQEFLDFRYQNLEQRAERVAAAIELSTEPVERLARRLTRLERQLKDVRAERQQLKDEGIKLPTRDDLANLISGFAIELQALKQGKRCNLSQIVTEIEAVPCAQFGTNKVVLRARFEIKLSGFLPFAVLSLLRNIYGESLDERLGTIPVLADLFEASSGPKYGLRALAIHTETHGSLKAVERALGINKRESNLAVNYGRQMQAAGVTDPFTELFERPSAPSRWRDTQVPVQQE